MQVKTRGGFGSIIKRKGINYEDTKNNDTDNYLEDKHGGFILFWLGVIMCLISGGSLLAPLKKLSGWYRFIIFSGIWTTIAITIIVTSLVSTGLMPYLMFYCFWFVPIGIAYLWGLAKDKGDTNDLSDYRKGTRNPD